jgi:ubiquinone/menaquinone biosynthesis C-methylase UbiE
MRDVEAQREEALPSEYPYVAEDIVFLCKPRPGVWLDIGSGSGGLGLALAARSPETTLVLLDPRTDALEKALAAAGDQSLRSRIVTVIGSAEKMPLPDACVDLVVSRGSVFFWQDRTQGIREAFRVLRPGGEAMIGGGLGRSYPAWARTEFIRRQRESLRRKGPEAMRQFREARSRETFERLAREAGLAYFTVLGEGGLSEADPEAGIGVWLRFSKE